MAPSLALRSSTATLATRHAASQRNDSASHSTAPAPRAMASGMKARPSDTCPGYAANASPARTCRLSAVMRRGGRQPREQRGGVDAESSVATVIGAPAALRAVPPRERFAPWGGPAALMFPPGSRQPSSGRITLSPGASGGAPSVRSAEPITAETPAPRLRRRNARPPRARRSSPRR